MSKSAMNSLIDKQTFLNDDYVNGLLSSGSWSSHGSDLQTWLDECDEVPATFSGKDLQRVINDTEFLNFFREWLSHRFDFAMKYLTQDINQHKVIRRAVYLTPAQKAEILPGAFVDVGKYWTVSGTVEPYGATCTEDREIVTITTGLDLDSIDLVQTMISRMDYVNGDYEMEIQTKENLPVKILSIE